MLSSTRCFIQPSVCVAQAHRALMSWVTVVWSMIASACLTLAVIYLLVWWRNRTAWAHLLFSRDRGLDRERGGAPRERGPHEPGRRCRRLRHLDPGPRAQRNLGQREVAGVVWLRAVGAAGIQRHPEPAAPDDCEGLRQAHAMAVAGSNERRYRTEFRLVLPDGATRWISSRGRVECDATGRPVLMRGASHDVTARKRAELRRPESERPPAVGPGRGTTPDCAGAARQLEPADGGAEHRDRTSGEEAG